MDWSCEICGKDTSNVDYDYLVGKNHLGCVLGVWGGNKAMKKNKIMKIKGWDKISGYTYKGFCIVNPIHNADETKYMADVINLNLPQKPKWELSVLMPNYKFKQDDTIKIILWDEMKIRVTKSGSKNIISSIINFRNIVEDMIDELLKLRSVGAPAISHSFQSGGASSGILNTISTSGTNIVVSGNNAGQISQYNLIDTIKELQKQIDELKKEQTKI